jgi:glutathionylspermidine synthase
MQRIACPERDDWRATAEADGFDFHSIDGERYWDERAYYAFTLDQIEREIEAPTGEIDAMCLELVDAAVDDERMLERLKIPVTFWPLISESWHRDDASLYGRIDLSFDGRGPAKLLEYNADTPTSIFEAAVFQWTWLEQAIERQLIPTHADQFNSIHERLIEAWKKVGAGRHLHLTGMMESPEDAGTLAYLEDTARQAGFATTMIDVEDLGLRDDGSFVDLEDRAIDLAFKLYPWEWMFHDAFGAKLIDAPTRWVEPPWKAILSNKGILPLLWEMFPNHPNLLPAYFDACGTARPLRRRRFYPPGLGAAAGFFRLVSGAGKLAGRSHGLRIVDP